MAPIPKVFSCVRSGTYFLIHALGENFESPVDLSKPVWRHKGGHVYRTEGKYERLLGGHRETPVPGSIYIVRDGRDVICSMYNSPDFHRVSGWDHAEGLKLPAVQRPPFKVFLREKINWRTISRVHIPESERKWTPAEHWYRHVLSWMGSGAHIVRYEQLYSQFEAEMIKIQCKFGLRPVYPEFKQPAPVGIYPNKSRPGMWREMFDEEDLDYFYSIVPKDFGGLWHG